MITSHQLRAIIQDQSSSYNAESWIDREVKLPDSSKRIIIISGVRQCGKSTMLRQKLRDNQESLYLNFEDPRLVDFELEDFEKLEKIFREGHGAYLLLDEIQNINEWERFARMANEKGIPLFITGSNASMLSRELGTRLTGRYRQIELYPFSFNEFLDYFNLSPNPDSFKSYFSRGGFPAGFEESGNEYHRTLLRDIITRDIALRKNISNQNMLVRLAIQMFTNLGKEFSYNRLAQALEIKSVRTVIDYLDYFRECYLLEYLPRFSYSIRKQQVNPKKAYAVDSAFARSNSLSFSEDLGRRMENIVYNQLRRKHSNIFYHRGDKSECDFLVRDNEGIVLAVQVCWEVNRENQEREIAGLRNAMKESGSRTGIIITHNQEDVLNGTPLIPIWKWLSGSVD